MSALLAADYRDRTIKVLEDLRDLLERRCDQAYLAGKDESASYEDRHAAFGNASAYNTARDDIILAIQREQGR
jgi:hypothetical protein